MWKQRYSVLAILFITWVVSYLDRMVMTVAIPYIATDFNLSPVAMGIVLSTFFAGYAIFQIPGGMLADKFGPRKVMTAGIAWWTIFTFITGMAKSLSPMLFIRFLFGVGEGVFPGSSWKTIANWFPVKERTTANGFMMSSNFLGPAIAPLFVVAVMAAWGWRAVFYSLLVPGVLIVLLLWFFVKDTPEQSSLVSSNELAEIRGNEPAAFVASGKKATFADIIKSPIAWQCFLTWFAYDITFWGFMSWVPTYLVKERGYEMIKMGITASVPFFAGTLGLILGGYLSDKFFKNNRKVLVVITNLLGASFLYATYYAVNNDILTCMTFAGLFIGMAFGSIWGLPMNVMPKEVMGAASGFINMAGQIAGFISPMVIGYLVQASGNFQSAFMFLIAGSLASAAVASTIRQKKDVNSVCVKNTGEDIA